MKKHFIRIIAAMIIMSFALMFFGCIGPEKNSEPPKKHDFLNRKEVLHILKSTARDFIDYEYEETTTKEIKSEPFLNVKQDEFITEMTTSDIEENLVIKDSKEYFKKAVESAIKITEEYRHFSLGKIYSISTTDELGEKIPDPDFCPIGIFESDDGGLLLLYYTDSAIESETIQITYYLNIKHGHSIVHSSAIYSSLNDDNTKGIINIDYMEFISDVSYETASLTLEIDNPLETRKIAKIINTDSEAILEIKDDIHVIEYGYSTFSNEKWNSISASYIIEENKWTPFMNNILNSLCKHIGEYGADFESLFTKKLTKIEISKIEESETELETVPPVKESESETSIDKSDVLESETTVESETNIENK